jgi:hypothetical protein
MGRDSEDEDAMNACLTLMTLRLPPTARRPERVEVEVTPTAPRVVREPRAVQAPVDFSYVPEEQRPMDLRLLNWALWCTDKTRQQVSAGFSGVKTDEFHFDKSARRVYGSGSGVSVNVLDAQAIARAIGAFAENPRTARYPLVLTWFYLRRCHDARGTADRVCLSVRGLAEAVIQARAALMSGGV